MIETKYVYDLVNMLQGVSSCATACPCCESMADSARRALDNFQRNTGITADDAYYGRTVARKWRDGTIWDESGLAVGSVPPTE